MVLKNNYRKELEKQYGITLISLIIIIVIVLIFVRITSYIFFEENGIINKIQMAKDKNSYESLKEEIEMVMLSRKIDNSNSLKYDLENGIGGNKKVEESEIVSDLIYITRDNVTITVYEDGSIEDGRVSVWDGISRSKPNIDNQKNWHIKNAEELKFFADFINGNLTDEEKEGIEELTSETIVYLENNIDLGARQIDGELTIGTSWTPINSYEGTFEGNNHIINGIYIKEDYNFVGFFNKVFNISNLTIKNSYIYNSKLVTGAIAGDTLENGIVENCNNINTTVISAGYVGGIFGQSQSEIVRNCSNSGNIFSTGKPVGGLIGMSVSKVYNCINTGEIKSTNRQVGGIIGYAYSLSLTSNCNNQGNVFGEDRYVGGIVGYSSKNAIIENCINDGMVSGNTGRVGGICGYINESTCITCCINNGNVSSKDIYTGGIVGFINKVTIPSTINGCINTGMVISTGDNTGGIIGIIPTSLDEAEIIVVQKCYNLGNIKGKESTGGIIGSSGQNGSVIEKCYNIGKIEGTEIIGGIIGNMCSASKIYNCYNTGNITGNKSIGGISGKTYNSACEIKNSYNIGNIIGQTIVGGIIGINENESTIENSYYLTGTALLDNGNKTESILAKNKDFLTTDFVNQANIDETIWIIDSNQNDGYPILKMD